MALLEGCRGCSLHWVMCPGGDMLNLWWLGITASCLYTFGGVFYKILINKYTTSGYELPDKPHLLKFPFLIQFLKGPGILKIERLASPFLKRLFFKKEYCLVKAYSSSIWHVYERGRRICSVKGLYRWLMKVSDRKQILQSAILESQRYKHPLRGKMPFYCR